MESWFFEDFFYDITVKTPILFCMEFFFFFKSDVNNSFVCFLKHMY